MKGTGTGTGTGTETTKRRFLLVALLAVAALVASACSDNDGAAPATTTTIAPVASSTTTAPTTTAAPIDPDATIELAPLEVELLDAGAEPRTQLRFQFEDGQVEQTITSNVQTLAQTFNGQEAPPTQIELTIVQDVAVAIEGEGTYRQTAEIRSVEVGPGTTVALIAQLETLYASVIGLQATTIIDDRGRITAIGVQTDNTALGDLISQVLGNSQLTSPLPEEAVGVGATWQIEQLIVVGGLEVPQLSTYELVAIEDERVELAVNSRQDVARGTVIEDPLGDAVVDDWDVTGAGSIVFDLTMQSPVSTITSGGTQVISFEDASILEQAIEGTVVTSPFG